MGDDIGLGSVTDCLLRLFLDLKRQTELHYVGWAKNNNKQNPSWCHHPLITQLMWKPIIYKKIYLPVHPFCNDALSVQTWCIQTAHRDQGQFLAIDIQWKGQTWLLEWNCDFFPLLHWHLKNWKMKAWKKRNVFKINSLKYLI